MTLCWKPLYTHLYKYFKSTCTCIRKGTSMHPWLTMHTHIISPMNAERNHAELFNFKPLPWIASWISIQVKLNFIVTCRIDSKNHKMPAVVSYVLAKIYLSLKKGRSAFSQSSKRSTHDNHKYSNHTILFCPCSFDVLVEILCIFSTNWKKNVQKQQSSCHARLLLVRLSASDLHKKMTLRQKCTYIW